MNILIIDNGSGFIKELTNSLNGNDVHIEKFGHINLKDINNFDKIVLSGGSFPVLSYKKEYHLERRLIKESKVPVLGICLGFELIATTFGEKLERMEAKEKEIIEVHKIKEDEIMGRLNNFKVFESHRWILKKCKKLTPLAESIKGIEIIRHPKRDLYGVQFHPEMFHRKTDGMTILNNFLQL